MPACHQHSAPPCKQAPDRPFPKGVAHLTLEASRLLCQGLRPHSPTPDLCRPPAAEWPSAHPESFANVSLYLCDRGAFFTHILMTRHLALIWADVKRIKESDQDELTMKYPV